MSLCRRLTPARIPRGVRGSPAPCPPARPGRTSGSPSSRRHPRDDAPRPCRGIRDHSPRFVMDRKCCFPAARGERRARLTSPAASRQGPAGGSGSPQPAPGGAEREEPAAPDTPSVAARDRGRPGTDRPPPAATARLAPEAGTDRTRGDRPGRDGQPSRKQVTGRGRRPLPRQGAGTHPGAGEPSTRETAAAVPDSGLGASLPTCPDVNRCQIDSWRIDVGNH